ncbi:MAG: acyl-CoA dehydrogenase family protein [Alphaproteobacteria bacterium]|jgi:alkylation response protein AidB-like acyl-CoA dehydrogenase
MTYEFKFDSMTFPPEADALRVDVRAFLREEIDAGTFVPGGGNMKSSFNPEFSRKVGAKGWLGMTWPKKYGGHERSQLERYVMTEEMLAHGAPVRAHWVADRQSGPVLIKYATEEVRQEVVPQIARGELYFCIGLSEPNSGSDLFAAATKATKVDGGWSVTGRKIWTSNAHRAHYMIALIRTSPATGENRRHGLTQFLIKMDENGPVPRPIVNLAGHHDFNEVVFDEVFVPDNHVIGTVDEAWKQATDELAYERSGPDRWTETLFSLVELAKAAENNDGDRLAQGLGREVAHLKTLRRMSTSVAGMLEDGKSPVAEAAVVKDLGTNWEQALPNNVRLLAPRAARGTPGNSTNFDEVMRYSTLIAPKLTIQGGTREVLRGIIARGLGLR